VLGLTLAFTGLSATLATPGDDHNHKHAKVDEAAPAFSLKDTKGTEHTLASLSGKTVVIEWFNPDCPYCMGVYKNGIVADTIKQLKEIDPSIVYMAINSTANKPADEVKAQSDAFLTEHKVEIPVLMDYAGDVGHAYDARTTPHMFVIDGKGVLRYQGAYTDDSSFKKADYANYVVNAVRQIKNGETVSPNYNKPWGCSVKYAKKGNQPDGPDKSTKTPGGAKPN